MEWEPNERDAWVADAQRWICQIKGVLQCKIDLDPDGEVTGVHVVAGTDRQPRHIVRDVEGLLKARLGLDVFYKKIGVVQVLNNGQAEARPPADRGPHEARGSAGVATGAAATSPQSAAATLTEQESAPAGTDDDAWQDRAGTAEAESARTETAPAQPAAAATAEAADTAAASRTAIPAVLVAEDINPRIVCSGVGVMASEMVVRAEVQLRSGDLEARGHCEGPNHAGSDLVLVARATLEAIGELLADPILLHLSEIRTTSLGGQDVLATAVDLVEGRRSETLFGTCATSHNRQQAVVYAILDALNRRLTLYALKSAAAKA